jgi:hypothetical protein
MKSLFDQKDNPGLLSGPLRPYVGIYEASLKDQGYKRPTLYPDLLLFADLDGWMKREGLEVKKLNERELGKFLSYHMRTRRTRRRHKQTALGRLLGLMRRLGVTGEAVHAPPTPLERKVSEFAEYLKLECGFAATTIALHRLVIGRFLSEIYGQRPLVLSRGVASCRGPSRDRRRRDRATRRQRHHCARSPIRAHDL